MKLRCCCLLYRQVITNELLKCEEIREEWKRVTSLGLGAFEYDAST